jgi:hypothetical protein
MPISEFSSSDMGFFFFFGAAFARGFGGADGSLAGRPRCFAGPAGFLGAAFALATLVGFAGGAEPELAPSSNESMSESSMFTLTEQSIRSPAGRNRY